MWKIHLVLCLMPVLSGAAFGGPQSQPAAPQKSESPRRALDWSLGERFGVQCHLRASREAVMGFGVPTTIAEVLVRAGQEVRKGQVLLRGDDREEAAILRLQRTRAETDLPVRLAETTKDFMEAEYKHLLDIHSKGGSGPQELERARLAFEKARLEYLMAVLTQTTEAIQVDRFQARVERYRVVAPFDGEVSTVDVDVGHLVTEADRVIKVVNVDVLAADVPADVGDPKTWSLKMGDRAWILVDVAGTPVLRTGSVTELDPTADLGSRSRRVRVEFSNPKGENRLLPGVPAWVRFTEPDPGLLAQLRLSASEPATGARPSMP
jgi:membrane fusion protein (multidrug efflux system)